MTMHYKSYIKGITLISEVLLKINIHMTLIFIFNMPLYYWYTLLLF